MVNTPLRSWSIWRNASGGAGRGAGGAGGAGSAAAAAPSNAANAPAVTILPMRMRPPSAVGPEATTPRCRYRTSGADIPNDAKQFRCHEVLHARLADPFGGADDPGTLDPNARG